MMNYHYLKKEIQNSISLLFRYNEIISIILKENIRDWIYKKKINLRFSKKMNHYDESRKSFHRLYQWKNIFKIKQTIKRFIPMTENINLYVLWFVRKYFISLNICSFLMTMLIFMLSFHIKLSFLITTFKNW